jgi:hypothetical protein
MKNVVSRICGSMYYASTGFNQNTPANTNNTGFGWK